MITHSKNRQQGVVLIMALLIVALVTTIVVSVSWRFNLSMARNENRWHGAQATAYLEGGEQLAKLMLQEDKKTSPNDHLGEMWARQSDPLPTDEGWIRGQVEDAHGRINLNLLYKRNVPDNARRGGTNSSVDPNSLAAQFNATQRRFIRLLQMLELENGPMPQADAVAITQAIQDWLDPDNNVSGAGGAERDYYQSLDPSYPITNGPMATVSELMIIKGMTSEIFEQLKPYVIALPENVSMNVNTMRPELMRIFNRPEILEPLPDADWDALVQVRNATMVTDENGAPLKGGFLKIQEFSNDPTVQAIVGENIEIDQLTVESNYFLFFGETLVGEQVRRSKALLFRSGVEVEVIRRTDANF